MKNIRQFKEKARKRYVIQKTDVFMFELEEITEYMAIHYYFDTAFKFKNILKQKLDILENNPEAYEKYKANKQFRYLIVENYKVFYKIDLENQIVYLSHIYDSRRKYFNLK